MSYFSLRFYSIDFKPCHYDPQVSRFIAMTFGDNSQVFFRIYFFLDHYVWIDVGSMMYMSGEVSFIVWVDWDAGSVSRLRRPINPLNARFDNQIAFA